NVERVISRICGFGSPTRGEIEGQVLGMMENERPGEVVQALMDLGATICRPNRPGCSACPLRKECVAFESGDPGNFPVRRRRKVRPHRYGVAWWIERDGHVWLVRRPASGLLGGMAALPGDEWGDHVSLGITPLGIVRHVFTHFTLDLHLVPAVEPV